MNRTLASQYFAGRNPIGKSVTLERLTGRPQQVQYEIIGVVADANYMEIRESSRRGLFLPAFANGRVTGNKLVVRTVPSPSGLAPTVLRAIHEVAPSVPVSDGTTLSAGVLPNLPANISTSVLAGMAIFFAAAVAATWFPARRAARINPVDSLRAE